MTTPNTKPTWITYDSMVLTYEQYEAIIFNLNMARAIAMANIVTAVLGDGSLDTDLICNRALAVFRHQL
ncbi:MAG: hypothetical protein MZU79_02555 [Anaerotruncus sp.]|nr:hypothetical protein [Anaerotruncus sp.]